MQVNTSKEYQQASEISNTIIKNVMKNYKDAPNKREPTEAEAYEDIECMVQIHQLIKTFIERVNSRII